MEGRIKFVLLTLLIYFSFFDANAQLQNGVHFKYQNRDFVVFEYFKGKVNLDFLSSETLHFEPNIYDSFKILDAVLNQLDVKKENAVQLYFYKDMNSVNHVYINLIDKRFRRFYKRYKTELISVCLDDCGNQNDFYKVYIYDIQNNMMVRKH